MRFLLYVLMLGCLVSCAAHSKDYLKKSQSIPPLVIPSDAAPLKQNTLYIIPSVSSQDLPKQSTSLKPPTMNN